MRRRSGRDHRGQTLVEFALILPIFILLLVGIFDFGRAVYAYNTISNASREAVRVGIVDQSCSRIGTEATGRAASLGFSWNTSSDPCVDDEGDAVISFLDPDGSTPTAGSDCDQPDADAGAPIGCMIEVTVNYEYIAATPIIGNIVGTLDLSSSTRQGVEFTNETP